MGRTQGPYNADFPVGTKVRIANREFLENFKRRWHYHHPLQSDQLDPAGAIAVVEKLGYDHGGDELYWLRGVPGIWHEECLTSRETPENSN